MKRKSTSRSLSSIPVLLTIALLSGHFAFGQQPAAADIVIGKRISIPSKVLNAEVPISVYLPAGYETSAGKYPVLYDLNAFAYFTYAAGTVELLARNIEMPEMIIVGLPNLQDGYVPTAYEQRGAEPAAADRSLKFFSEELIPFIDKNYRTAGFNVLCGHSVGGLFTMYALFTRPELFSGYIASSPWFQNNDQYWLKHVDRMFQTESLAGKFLFMEVGKKEQALTLSTYTELEKWMKSRDLKGLVWKSEWLENVDHSSMLGLSLYSGLMFVFEGWKIPFDVIASGDVAVIREHGQKMTEKFKGRLVYDVPENLLNQVAYQLLSRKSHDTALKLFALNVELHPNSPNTYDSLAECYLAMGDKQKAKEYYELAIQNNPGKTDNDKRILQNSKAKLEELNK